MYGIVRPLPVLFACQGCPEYGNRAHEVALALDARGFGEAAWLGTGAAAEPQLVSRARSRFPIYALDGCAKGCAAQWLARHGVTAQRQFAVAASGDTPARIADRIVAGS